MDTSGYENRQHRRWQFPGESGVCPRCTTKGVGMHQQVELMLRQTLAWKLRVENDSFEEKFRRHPDITFRLAGSKYVPMEATRDETTLIDFYLTQKLVLGVSVQWKAVRDDELFVLPVMKDSKMWQLLMRYPYLTVCRRVWASFEHAERLRCLVCTDYPFDIYPGNFVVNESVYSIKTIVWPDSRRPHYDRRQDRVIVYYRSARHAWPFLSAFFRQEPMNHLGNMALYTTGEIFSKLLDLLLQKVEAITEDNRAIDTIRTLIRSGEHHDGRRRSEEAAHLRNYYRKRGKRLLHDEKEREGCLDVLRRWEEGREVSAEELKRHLRHPRTKISPLSVFKTKGMAIRRGEIDEAITQTRQLHKDRGYADDGSAGPNPNGGGGGGGGGGVGNNNRVGRFSKNIASNSYVNMCNVACGLQKVLPKDSKAVEPRTIDDSDVGFVDLLHTPDTPQRCGILLEAVPDVLVATWSLCCDDPASELFRPLFPSMALVANPNDERMTERMTAGPDRYVLINHSELYALDDGGGHGYEYVRYLFKCRYACVELLAHGPRLWSCNSLNRMAYKIGPDGLLYTSKEMDLNEEGGRYGWWPGRHRERVPNVMGPSMVVIGRPNSVHLPRLSNACCAMRHYAGTANNTRSTGQIHQKIVLSSYYNFRDATDHTLPIPAQYPLVCVVNWDNPEDAITVKGSSLERGLFMGESNETITVRVTYTNRRPTFRSTYRSRGPLRYGTILGRIVGVTSPDINIHNYSFGGEIEWQALEETADGTAIDLVWVGKSKGDAEDPFDDSTAFAPNEHDWRIRGGEAERRARTKRFHRSLAHRDRHPNHLHYRCVTMKWEHLVGQPACRFRLVIASQFVPSLGDKLQTPTSQKGVIGRIVEDDADMPYINTADGQSLMPDVLINAHFVKRQALDIFTNLGRDHLADLGAKTFLNDCFRFRMGDTERCLRLGEELATGRLMNPYTGAYYRGREAGGVVRGSLFRAHYVCVTNHRASTALHSSRAGDTQISEFSGAPVRGRQGGFAIGPMEHFSLAGAQRIDTELSHMRSDYETTEIQGCGGEREEVGGTHRLAGSAAFRRIMDDWRQAGIPVALEATAVNTQVDVTRARQ